MIKRTKIKISVGVTALGVVLLVLGILFGWVILPAVIDSKIKQEVKIEEGNLIYENWVDIPIPMYLKAYLFNLTNPEDFLGEGASWNAKPKFKEFGPYVYE